MAFAASLAEIQAEASCPLCLDYLKDPVTLDCGHNFCSSCIHQRWEDLQCMMPCPICFHGCSGKNFKRNSQLCHITDIIKHLPMENNKRKRQEKKLLCEKHNEVLDTFCEEDLELMCLQCASSDHQDHHLICTKEAAVKQRKKLKRCLEGLSQQLNDANEGCENQLRKCLEGRWKIEDWKEQLHPEFELFNIYLKQEHILIQTRLLDEEKVMEEKLIQNKSQIFNHMNTLKKLLSEIMKCLQSDHYLLESSKDLQSRYENQPSLIVYTHEFETNSHTILPHYFGLHKMISTFQENLTLDPQTAHPSLTISEDRKCVTVNTSLPLFLDDPWIMIPYPAVLCHEDFARGRHFWQVEIKGRGECSIGMCTESFRYKQSPVPEDVFWQLDLTLKLSATHEQTEQIERIGVFLDYELGELSFYNLKCRSCMHRITGKLTEKVKPFFAIGPFSNSLTIRMITEQ